jgi:16S rRNA (cytidine1402-2'-O)-methyltransferase
MSLTVVSVPIGNYGDITLRAKETLESVDCVICEEIKPASILYKRLGIPEKEFFQLNEHSTPKEISELVQLCKSKNVALISDCGTPGFYDPGPELVAGCVKEGISVDVNPGASSLMALLSLSGVRLKSFNFVGFLPAEKSERLKEIQKLKKISVPFILMDTPYRLTATLQDLAQNDLGGCKAVLGVDLTGPAHRMARGSIKELSAQEWQKLPFVLLVVP